MGLELIKCERKYWDFVLELRNSLREGFIDQETIQVKDHYKYMQSYCKDYYIALEDGEPVGWVGEINKDIRVDTTIMLEILSTMFFGEYIEATK